MRTRERRGKENDKAGREGEKKKRGGGVRKSRENGERDAERRREGRRVECELQSVAKTRKVRGSQRERDGNLERWEAARQTTRVSECDVKERRR